MAESQVVNSSDELLKKVADYEKLLQQKNQEIENYKKRIAAMETEVAQAQNMKVQRAKENEEVNALKVESEQTLTKAKSIIFERTKVIKNQELQIEAYSQQIESLKDVVRITKDLLEIRNLEVKQLENKINCMEERIGAERERQDLMHKKLETMIRHNGELKREYEAQLCLFTALRERYSERELARDVVENMKANKAPEVTAPIVNGVEESTSNLENNDKSEPIIECEKQNSSELEQPSGTENEATETPNSMETVSNTVASDTSPENVEKQ
ncbi:uncharacterized protein [Leptinotarsa decemlineata]|uniref:uncharacterized protein n=1 Tax=Leptinotarsa decemlineata TaxID=7539 RepID=UPI000C255801|nr:putative leucine-rich repeat-containing protein DDB_G0290503 [Leptinotarsa decemlineata]